MCYLSSCRIIHVNDDDGYNDVNNYNDNDNFKIFRHLNQE
jgi:hypothetical protein